MPPAVVAAPILLSLAGAVLIAALGLAGIDAGRLLAPIGAWAAVVALAGVWVAVRSTLELTLGELGYGSALDLRIDGVAFVFGLMVTVPAALLLTLQRRPWQESALAMAALTAAIAAVEAGGVVLTAIAGGAAASLAVVLLDTEDVRAPRPRWGVLFAAWLALAWLGVVLQVRGGTAVYSAVPVSSVTAPVFVLLAVAAVLASGMVPWRSWPAQLWARPSLRAAGITVACLYPLGFYLLVRAYELGNGRYPLAASHAVLAALGVAVSLGAAVRAQAAPSRREFLADVIPGLGGFALMALALGTPVGLVAGLLTLVAVSAMLACLALVPDAEGIASLVCIAAAAGLPPGLVFGALTLGIEATFEAGDPMGLIGLAAIAAWGVWIVAAARAVGLPAGTGRPRAETLAATAAAIAGATLVAGPALAVLQAGLTASATADVMEPPVAAITGGLISVVTVSTVLPALTLFAPLLLIALGGYALTGIAVIRPGARPPVVALPALRLY